MGRDTTVLLSELDFNKRLKYFGITVVLLIIILLPTTKSIFVENFNSKSLYDDATLIITEDPVIEIPRDLEWCFEGESQIDCSVVYYNFDIDNEEQFTSDIFEFADYEFDKAGMSFNVNEVEEWQETPQVYYDYEFENELVDRYRDGEEVVICFANLDSNKDDINKMTVGYTRVRKQVIIILIDNIEQNDDFGSYALAHEMGHQMGLTHVDDDDCLMYQSYLGGATFCQESIDRLVELHG